MDFYIALCPHFHQPHFQREDILKAVFKASYQPWVVFMDRAYKADPDFVMNAHLSGPLLQYCRRVRTDYLAAFKQQLDKGLVRLVGGMADESFTQLSSRPDDTFFQVSLYRELVSEIFGVEAGGWDGFHIPERECGENLVVQLTRALASQGALPLFYLDVETFFHSRAPEAEIDPVLRSFDLVDPMPKTVVPYFSQAALHGIYRDEVLGREYFVVPIHAAFRYLFLKRRSLQGTDPMCSPAQYLQIVREKAQEAGRLIRKMSGRAIAPLILIYTDAEVLGQWSGDPEGDMQWLLELVALVKSDPEARFTTMRGYFDAFGFVDTYPIRTSTSSAEFEHWTMKRGIRGVSYADPQLRRVISVLRELEETQEAIERIVLDRVARGIGKRIGQHPLLERIHDKVLNSHRRHELVRDFLLENWGEDEAQGYETINRIRNLVYQEDPRWAGRQPSFGAGGSFDLTGLGYCAVAQKLGEALISRLSRVENKEKLRAVLKDWDKDGNDEAVISNAYQSLVISKKGGTIVYHQIHSPELTKGNYKDLLAFGQDILANRPMFPMVGCYSQCLLHTETDSDLCVPLDGGQSRVERCRDSLRLNVLTIDGSDMIKIGDLDTAMFEFTGLKHGRGMVEVELSTVQRLTMRSETLEFAVKKVFTVDGATFACKIVIEKLGEVDSNRWNRLLIAPEIVNSITPADEINAKVDARICLHDGGRKGTIRADIQQTVFTPEGFDQRAEAYDVPRFEGFAYAVQIKTPRHGAQVEEYVYVMSKKTEALLRGLFVTPAVRRLHSGYVFDKSSRLGFHQSGIKIQPLFALNEGTMTTYEISMQRRVHTLDTYKAIGRVIPLIQP